MNKRHGLLTLYLLVYLFCEVQPELKRTRVLNRIFHIFRLHDAIGMGVGTYLRGTA